MKYTPKIEKALKTAAVLHQHQTRKSEEAIPYIIHPYGVAIIVSNYTDDEDTLVSALLHDTIEDSEYTPGELENDFGKTVRNIVLGVTEPKKDESGEKLPWKVRKEAYIENLKGSSPESLLVCAADKIYNMRSILDDRKKYGDKLDERFSSTPEQRLWYNETVFEILKENLDSPILTEYERLLEETKNSY
jgi:(p)ppGpp synthase/HD superfamily hydrolase